MCDVNTLFDFLRIPCFFVPSGLGFLDEVLSVLVAFVLIYPGPSDGRLLTYGGVVEGRMVVVFDEKWMNWRHDDIEVRHRDESCSG